MSRRRQRRWDGHGLALVVIGAAFVLVGMTIALQPAGLVTGALVVVFFGAVAVVGLGRLRAGPGRPLPAWSLVAATTGLAVACLVVALLSRSGPRSPASVVLERVSVLGVLVFGAGVAVHVLRRVDRKPLGRARPRRRRR